MTASAVSVINARAAAPMGVHYSGAHPIMQACQLAFYAFRAELMTEVLKSPNVRVAVAPAPLVTVDEAACRKLATLISTYEVPIDREDNALPSASRLDIGNFYFWLVAICHQTSPKGGVRLAGTVNGRNLQGWDYLSARFEAAIAVQPRLLTPETWTHMTGDDLRQLFRDQTLGDRLTDPDGRAGLIRDLGSVMIGNGWKHFEDLYRLAGRRILEGDPNLLQLLSRFRAYNDPVHKKAYFLLALMRNGGLWTYADDWNLGAPVDYHEIRGHLRIGTVTINDRTLKEKVQNETPVTAEEDVAIRTAVHDAIMLVSELTEIRNPSRLHYLFWNVFRSCCTRNSPHCRRCPVTCTLPPRYVPLALASGVRRCPFAAACKSAGNATMLTEHVFTTDWY